MQKLSPDGYTLDKDSLLRFFEHCAAVAEQKQHFVVASITIPTQHIDPLAVLESVYEEDDYHFYSECTAQGEAVAGIEAVLAETFEGPERFERVKQFSEEILEHTIAVGDFSVPFAGPHFFCGFTFSDDKESAQAPFAPASVFLPRFQVARKGGAYAAVANMVIQPGEDVAPLIFGVWAAYNKFNAFDYSGEECEPPKAPKELIVKECGVPGGYEAAVAEAVEAIRANQYQKIVLARALDVQQEEGGLFDPLEPLYTLREKFPSCYAFSFSCGSGKSFMGATPERLLRVEDSVLKTEALAGSVRRGTHAREDAKLEKRLLSSDKDQREHQYIVDYITSQLEALNIEPEVGGEPRLLKLHNVQHLLTPITAQLPEPCHALDVLQALHPTPAVGGIPVSVIKDEISRLEAFDRGLYAGTLGWFNDQGNSETIVAIRSALIDGKTVRLYAGAGIVEGSVPEKEKQETDLKFSALGDVFGVNHVKESARL
tara:strand:- start:4974 stop:6431 length:1458 start_codon:yes stop_codon:yes gene_type:complete